MLDKLREALAKRTADIIIGSALSLALLIAVFLRSWSDRHIFVLLSKSTLGMIVEVSLLVVLAEAAWLTILLIRSHKKLLHRFNVKWSADYRACCPVCGNLLRFSNDRVGPDKHVYESFFCELCQRNRYIRDDNGGEIEYEQARNKLMSERGKRP